MHFRILGPLEVLNEGCVVTLGGSKQRALLALFLVHANETLTIDRLIDELLGESPPANAAKTMQVRISRLRHALGAGAGGDLIVTRERGYEFRLDPEQLDSHQFERLTAEGTSELAAGRPEPAAETLERRSRCGGTRRLRSWHTNRSPKMRSPASRTCAPARSSS